jgi:hypothetical protein
MVVFALVLGFACKEQEKQVAKEVGNEVRDRVGEAASKVRDKTIEAGGAAREKLGEATEKVVEVGGDVLDRAVETGKKAKVELAKVYKSDHDYDLAIDAPDSAEAKAHAARMEKMPSVDIKGVRVAYEEDSQLSLRGTQYMKHFRATWKRSDGKVVRVSFYTKETLDAVAFAQLLGKLVPVVELVVK